MVFANKVNYSFKDLMLCLCKTFGGKHRVAECTSEILQFSTRFNEELAEILLRWHKAKFEEESRLKRIEIVKKNEKRSWNDECWKCGSHGHKQKDCMKDKEENEVNLIEEQTNNDRKLDSYALTVVSLDIALKSPDAMQIQVQIKELGIIHALADTGASICAMKDSIAQKFKNLITKDDRPFL
ncbi:hypothetical protein RFI_39587, partial [Reticulomyxa filosa]